MSGWLQPGVFEGVGEDGEAVEGAVGVDYFGEVLDGGREAGGGEGDGAEGEGAEDAAEE